MNWFNVLYLVWPAGCRGEKKIDTGDLGFDYHAGPIGHSYPVHMPHYSGI